MPNLDNAFPRPPMALIVTGQEWVSLSMMTLFSPRGFAVLRAFNGSQAIQRVKETSVDLLVIDKDLRDTSGVELTALLRAQDLISLTTPILLLAPSPWPRDEKLAALRAGAWDACSLPMDGEELLLRLDGWVRAKLAGDQTRDQGLLDVDTGLYNAQGLLRRISEIGAVAVRHKRPLACVVLSPEADPELAGRSAAVAQTAGWSPNSVRALAAALTAAGRASDTIGRLSATEFVIVAPDTDAEGVIGLAERIRSAMETAEQAPDRPMNLRIGCYAVPNFRDASIAPTEMLIRAAEALRGEGDSQSIRFFNRTLESAN
jgi:PleD family two-component response regulator